jgi:hypothetical protein
VSSPALEAEVYLDLDDLPMTWERDAGPFLLALLRRGMRRRRTLAEAPIGMWRLPSAVGEIVTSAWPACFRGPLDATRLWELRVSRGGEALCTGACEFPRLWKLDTLEVTVTLTGVGRRGS